MTRPLRRPIASAAPLLLTLVTACSGGGGDQPGAVSADEARQLNEAAEMLDANSVALNALSDNSQDQP